MMKMHVGIVGVGNMGGGMASNLLSRGWAVAVCDIDADKVAALVGKGAQALASPQLIAQHCDVTIVCVVDAAQTQSVLFGPNGTVSGACGQRLGKAQAHAVMLCPTIAPNDVEAMAAELKARGIDVLDAPLSGGPARAGDGTMSVMLACADNVHAGFKDLLDALSSKVFRISERPGDGARTKLVNNLLAGINLVGAAEALALAHRLGLDMSTTLNVIAQSSGQSWIGSDRMRRAIADDFAPRAHVTLLAKDTRLAIEAAEEAGFNGPLGHSARDTFALAMAQGFADWDDAAILRVMMSPPRGT